MSEQPGHNSKEQLRSIVERVERLNEEKAALQSDIKDVFTEARGNGFDVRALRSIIRIRAEDPNKRAEREAILETYMQTLGMT
ncbi:DUF2312 domain-containing protein [Bradyrhizobium sp. USDA 4452]